jgi:hypothetical protein
MNHYKTIIWDDLPIDQIIDLIPIPSASYMNHDGFVGPIDQNIANEIAQLLKIDTAQCDFCSIMLCYFPPDGKLPVHTDKPVDADPHQALTQCIILPLQNCEKVRWDWYEVTDPAAIYYQGAKETSIPMIPLSAGKIVGSKLCDQPFISDIGTWHMLENPTDQAAMMLSIRLMPWSRQLFQECNTLPPVPAIRLAG